MSQSDDLVSDIKGLCGHCKLEFKLIASSGLLRKHGGGIKNQAKRQCPGSYSIPINPFILQSNVFDSEPTPQSPTFLPHPELTELKELFNSAHKHHTLRFIPLAARSACRNLLTTLLKAVVEEPDNQQNWALLLKFPFKILKCLRRGGRKHNTTNIIQKRVTSFYLPALPEQETYTRSKKQDNNAALAAAVTQKIECGNLRAAVRLISQDEGLAPINDQTLKSLQDMHPKRTDKQSKLLNLSSCCLRVNTNEITCQLKSFAKGSSGGPDLLSPQHLQDLISGPDDCSDFICSLTEFINILLEGTCPKGIAEILCGARLIALKKDNGKIRPIAIGCVYRRIAAKCANALALNSLKPYFGSLQLGVGFKAGVEAAVHATRNVLSNLANDHCIAKLDISNAFNSIKRKAILEAVGIHLPSIFNFCRLCYDQDTSLFFNGSVINSSEGVQQGDPLGCTLFSLAIQPAIELMNSKFKVGYVDDITISDKIDTVDIDVLKFEQHISTLGLRLNYSKCELIGNINPLPDSILSNFTQIESQNCELLGAPLTKGPCLDSALQSKVDDLNRIIKRLSIISSHDALIILKNSLSLPKLNFLLRCSPCTGNTNLHEFDQLLKTALSTAVNVDLSAIAWKQASLPVRVGGLGLRCTVDLASSAFLASSHSSLDLCNILYPQNTFNKLYYQAFDDWFTKYSILCFPQDPSKQKNWDQPCVSEKLNELTSSQSEPIDKARILALQSPKSGAWLEAWPISSCGLRMTDDEVRISVGIRLGAPVCTPHNCKLCGAPVDVKGTHGLSCRRSAGRHSRHSLINDIVARSLAKIHIPTMREPILNYEDSSRVDGCSLIPWQNGKAIAWDATVADTLAASHLPNTAVKSGAAASKAAEAKYEKYRTLPNNFIFIPLAFETLGPIHSESLNFLKNLATKVSIVTADKRQMSYLFQRLSVAIQKGNAISILGSINGHLNDDSVFKQ